MGRTEKSFFEGMTNQDVASLFVNLNRLRLNSKPHIKKYNRLRNLHGEILSSMYSYIFRDKYDIKKLADVVDVELKNTVDDFEINLDTENANDLDILLELFAYDNHPDITPVTDIYLEKKKFKNLEKIKLLEAMKNSYASLFKIISADSNEGYVIYQDVFTKEKIKIIDIALSSTFHVNEKKEIYTYNRIITVDDISFATGMHCEFSSDSKSLMEFVKSGDYKRCSGFKRCLLLYNMAKKEDGVISTCNRKFGNKRR